MTKSGNTIKNFDKDKSKTVSSNNKLAVFFIFLLISFGFWILNYLTGTYVNTYNCSVIYENLPSDKVLIGSPTHQISVTLRAKGFKLLKKEIANVDLGIPVNMNAITLLDSVHQHYCILTSSFNPQINAFFGNNYEIMEVKPDTIYLDFDKENIKKVPVKLNVAMELKKQYRISRPVKITPDSIILKGPKKVLDTMNYVYSKVYVFDSRNTSFSSSIEISKNNFFARNVKISKDKVDASWIIERYTERSIMADVTIQNSDVKIQTFPSKVLVYFKVDLKDYDKISENSFKIGFELNNKNTNSNNKALLKVYKKPDFVDIIRIVPDNVEFIIRQQR